MAKLTKHQQNLMDYLRSGGAFENAINGWLHGPKRQFMRTDTQDALWATGELAAVSSVSKKYKILTIKIIHKTNQTPPPQHRGGEMKHERGTTKMTTLREYNNEIKPITYLWIAGVGCPAGAEYRHWDQQPDGSADEDYCDVTEVIDTLGLWSLTGTIDDDGRWEWDGTGDPSDQRGNKIYNVKSI